MDFAVDLRQYGPASQATPPSAEQARRYTRELATRHYENFPVLSVFVPGRLRQHFANVYAYCRWADDLGDEVADRQEAFGLLEWWKVQLEECYNGRPTHPVMIALKETIDQFHIPRKPFLDLIAAFQQDQRLQRYETFEQLLDYCSKSANPVGRIVLYLCERHTDANVEMSDQVCTGLQLINFWQDVARDYDIGRIYIPQVDLDRFGVSEAQIAERRYDGSFARLLEFEVQRAERLLQSGLPLANQMPGRLRIVISLFARGGLAIAAKIRSRRFDVLSSRPKLRKWDFAALFARALVGAAAKSPPLAPEPKAM